MGSLVAQLKPFQNSEMASIAFKERQDDQSLDERLIKYLVRQLSALTVR